MRHRLDLVNATRARRRVEMECEKALASIERAYLQMGEPFPHESRGAGPFADFSGVYRGLCERCPGCPGYDLPRCQHEPTLLSLCAHCGSDAKAHELARTEKDKKADREDDILKNHKWDS